MKSILLSIKPEWAAKILNGEKTIEIRKKFPKDYKGWVYIYCTKGKPKLNYHSSTQIILGETDLTSYRLNGKVVARFYCDKVDTYQCVFCDRGKELDKKVRYSFHLNCIEIFDGVGHYFSTKEQQENLKQILTKSCLCIEQLIKYLSYNEEGLLNFVEFQSIHISKLEVLDKPKELSEFNINKAPQNYCYIKEEILRYLCVWDCQKGLPSNEPYKIPFEYQENDYFVISNVGKVNYKPCGKEYNGKKSEILEKNKISDGVYYVFDGSEWILNGGNI